MKRAPGGGSVPPPGRLSSPAVWPRSRTFGLLAGMYLCRPTSDAIVGWRILLGKEPPAPLRGLHACLLAIDSSREAVLEDLLWEYTRLFIGPYRLPAPPWESVYTSPKRLLMQEAHDAVQAQYAEAGLSIPDPHVLADHIGSELNFLSILHARAESEADGEVPMALAERFLSEHLRRWVPAFCKDLEAAAEEDLYRELARVTRSVVAAD